ncbi:uncharacterized protein METZ01_LOCUS73440, partial [marine metagenome]
VALVSTMRAWVLAIGVVCVAPLLLARQTGTITVWDGVYTAEQASRGRLVYRDHCSSCHLSDLSGAGEARSLADDAFMDDWREGTLGTLFGRVRTLMPFDDPATLDDQAYLESLAYILAENGFPAGGRALTLENVADIRIEAEDGPGEVPSFAMVRAVGCLDPVGENSWRLSYATAPVRTQDPSVSNAEELSGLATTPLGVETFTLVNVYPDPTPHVGHKMEVKGFLIRDPNGDRINVSSVGMVAGACRQR